MPIFWISIPLFFTIVDKNSMKIVLLDEFKVAFPASASKNKPLEISFFTPTSGPDDYVKINTVDSDSDFSITITGNSIVIPIEELKRQKKIDAYVPIAKTAIST